MRSILMTSFEKPVYAQKHPDFHLQISCFESEYVEVYRGLGGVAPKVTGFGE